MQSIMRSWRRGVTFGAMARGEMSVLVVGGGIGGLTTALALHERGIRDVSVLEASRELRELGVGINTLPHAIRALRDLGLLDALDAVALRTAELFYLNRQGQQIWHEARGLDAGHDVPQLSIHRGMLQGVIANAVRERLGPDAVRTGHRLTGIVADDDGVTVRVTDRSTDEPRAACPPAPGRSPAPGAPTSSWEPTASTPRSARRCSPARGRRAGTAPPS